MQKADNHAIDLGGGKGFTGFQNGILIKRDMLRSIGQPALRDFKAQSPLERLAPDDRGACRRQSAGSGGPISRRSRKPCDVTSATVPHLRWISALVPTVVPCESRRTSPACRAVVAKDRVQTVDDRPFRRQRRRGKFVQDQVAAIIPVHGYVRESSATSTPIYITECLFLPLVRPRTNALFNCPIFVKSAWRRFSHPHRPRRESRTCV